MSNRDVPFPGFDQIYGMSDPVLNAHFRGRIEVDLEEAIRLDRSDYVPSNPVVVRHAMGSATARDVIWTTLGIPMIVSQRLVDVLRKEGVTGWSSYPVVVYGNEGNELDGYMGFATTGRCAAIDYSRSKPQMTQIPGGREMLMYEGQYFDPTTWDGSDVFEPEQGFGGRFVIARVKTVLEQARVRNLLFEPMSRSLTSPDVVAKRIREQKAEQGY